MFNVKCVFGFSLLVNKCETNYMQQLVILLLSIVPQHVSVVFTPILRRSDCVFTAYVYLSCCDCCYVGECTQHASRLSNITTVTTEQITICSENAVWPLEDGCKDDRNMLRNNWLTIKSLIVASSWSHIYLLIKDARSLEHKVSLLLLSEKN